MEDGVVGWNVEVVDGLEMVAGQWCVRDLEVEEWRCSVAGGMG